MEPDEPPEGGKGLLVNGVSWSQGVANANNGCHLGNNVVNNSPGAHIGKSRLQYDSVKITN
jgi:hypothetical protein